MKTENTKTARFRMQGYLITNTSIRLTGNEIGEDMENAMTKLIKKYCPNSRCIFKKDIYDKTRFVFIFDK